MAEKWHRSMAADLASGGGIGRQSPRCATSRGMDGGTVGKKRSCFAVRFHGMAHSLF